MSHIPFSLRFILGFSGVGLLFSAYLVVVKIFSGTCPVNETCPSLFNIPACWYGLALFIVLITLSVFTARERISFANGIVSIMGVSFFGVLYAGYFTAIELPTFMHKGFTAYTFGVPTCFMGLVFFMLTFVTATFGWNHYRQHQR